MPIPSPTVYAQGQGVASGDGLNTFIQTVTNVAQLRTIVGLAGMQVYIKGTGVADDGGQGNFFWLPTATSADDNGATTVKPSSVTGTGAWIRLGAANIYIAFQYLGGAPPTSQEVMEAIIWPAGVEFPANFFGSLGSIITNPSATFVIQVLKNNVAAATITVSTAGAYTFVTASGLPLIFATGDTMIFVAPETPDATAAGLFFTLIATPTGG